MACATRSLRSSSSGEMCGSAGTDDDDDDCPAETPVASRRCCGSWTACGLAPETPLRSLT